MTFEQWLNTPGQNRCYLVEAKYRLAGEEKNLYRATHPYRTGAADVPAYQPFVDGITDMGEFERDMTEVFTGQSRSQIGSIDMAMDDETRHLAQAAHFGGGSVTIKIGAPDWAYTDFVTVVKDAVGNSLDISSSDVVTLSFKDRASVFAMPVQPNLIQSGPSIGKPKPICLGRCFNVSPVLIDQVANTWMVHDGAIEGITALRENGNAITVYTDHLDGTFTINRSVTGRITADVEGAKPAATWLQTGEQFIDYILQRHAFASAVDVGVFPSYLLGLYIDSEMNIDAVFDKIVSCFVGSWQFDRQNNFRLRLKQVAA